MLAYIFDTDHLTLFEHGHAPLMSRLTAEPPDAVGTTVITVDEALRGRLGYLSRASSGPARVRGYTLLLGTFDLLHTMPIVPYNDASDAEFRRLRSRWPQVGTRDLGIAAIVMSRGLTLLTRNRRDFGRITGLSLADWSV